MENEIARINMIKQQLRTWNVLDDQILDLVSVIHREDFVDKQYQDLAFADYNLPIGHQQVMMTPAVEAKALQALAIKPTDKALEIGTGSGYLTALLARLSAYVYSVELFDDFISSAQEKLNEHHIDNVTLQQGNAAQGWDKQQPYDVICLTGSLQTLPHSFRQQLKIGGRLFAVLGQTPVMEAVLITRVSESNWQTQALFETHLPPLLHCNDKQAFRF